MEILEEKSTQMRLELPADLNEALLSYKRSLKRLTGRNVNKDELIISILKTRIPTIMEKVRKMDSEYANRFIKK